VSGERLGGRERLLLAAAFVMFFDRFSLPPLLIPIARDLRQPLPAVAAAATAYFVLYGAMQVVYGLLSDRVGRVRLMRVTCLGAAAAGLLSAAAPGLPVLVVGRALTGGLICAVFPAALTYIADRFPFAVRQRAVADLLTAVALGTATAAFGAGLLAEHVSWRAAFLLPALAMLGLGFALRWLPESLPAPAAGSPVRQLREAARRPWVVFLSLVALPEGAVILGCLAFLAPALEAHGTPPAVAGLVTGAYGLAVLAGTQVVRRLRAGVRPWALIAGGGACLAMAFAAAALRQSAPVVLASSALAGLAYATMHSTFQTWATEVAPESRGTATALFATSAFCGAGLATVGLAGLAGARDYAALFWIAAAVTAPTMAVGAVGRWRFPDRGVGAGVASGSGSGSAARAVSGGRADGPGPGPGT
jgi:predicted MFS family arabinose efflux permease